VRNAERFSVATFKARLSEEVAHVLERHAQKLETAAL